MASVRSARTVSSQGPSRDSFAAADWALLAGVAVTWGASFLLIKIGGEGLRPPLLATLRLAFGAVTLAVMPAARRPVPRRAWPAIALLGLTWMAVPFVLFPLAEQRIGSSLADMLNAAAPLFTATIAALWWGRVPRSRQRLGLTAGLAGVVAICWPSLRHTQGTAAGVGLVLLATLLYGVAFNLAAPLQARYGALPVIWRAEAVALVVLAPFGIAAAPSSSFGWPSLLAAAALGCLGTAAAFAAFATLAGRAGPTRASVTVYFVPAVAIALGAARGEPVIAAGLFGTALVIAGAYATSREAPEQSQKFTQP